jgi:hypothetical protein
MKPKLILLLVLAMASITFMAFLVLGTPGQGNVCQQKDCCKKPVPANDNSGGGDDAFDRSFNHLIVSTRK